MSESKTLLLQPNFSDHRGDITDIFVNSPKDHCCIITNNDGAIRANHYHKLSTQYTYVIDGSLKMASVIVSKSGEFNKSDITFQVLEAGSLVVHKPYEAHAFKSINQSKILAFACGIRGGNNYENDVYRLTESLFE